jgi:N-acetyl-anhydromuramyl-L-alanine amidase AmpD
MIVREIIIHHSASSRDKTTIQDIDAWHKLRWPDFKGSLGFWIGYHFVITGDGELTQTRRANELGAHCIPNEGKVGICLTGNFDIETPNPEQLITLQALIEKIKKEFNLTDKNLYCHKEKSLTACPGKKLIVWVESYRKLSFLEEQIRLIKKLIEAIFKKRSE